MYIYFPRSLYFERKIIDITSRNTSFLSRLIQFFITLTVVEAHVFKSYCFYSLTIHICTSSFNVLLPVDF